MAKYGMVIDLNKCTGCYNCFLACRDEFAGNENPGYSAAQPMSGQNWIRVLERERGQFPKVKVAYTPLICMHCDNAGCIKMAKDRAVYRRPDGIVIIDPVKAKGQKQIVSACPYRVIDWNEELQLPQKCTFCAHILDKGEKEPRCVESCPAGAIVFGDLDDAKSEISKLMASGKAVALHPEYELKEHVKYIGIVKKFVAGTVIYGDIDECASGVTITLTGNDGKKETKTDNFGDFEFEGLPDNTEYTLIVNSPKYKEKMLKVKTLTDTYVGEILLKK
jgi:Fe-S-cluster-containing dehydrogenase component